MTGNAGRKQIHLFKILALFMLFYSFYLQSNLQIRTGTKKILGIFFNENMGTFLCLYAIKHDSTNCFAEMCLTRTHRKYSHGDLAQVQVSQNYPNIPPVLSEDLTYFHSSVFLHNQMPSKYKLYTKKIKETTHDKTKFYIPL